MSKRAIFWRFVVSVAVFCLGSVASAAPAIDAGTIEVHPDTVKTFVINVTGGDAVQGLDLYLQIGDGGAVNGGTDVRPIITNVDIVSSPTLFSASNTGQQNVYSSNLLRAVSTTTDPNVAAYLNASGPLAYVTIDASGTAAGQSYNLLLSGVAAGIYGPPGIDTGFAGVPALITNGVIHVVSGLLVPDFNNDGLVNEGDLSLMVGNWRQSGKTWVQGDCTDDGLVNEGDFSLLVGYWNWTRPGPPPEGAPLPEPASASMLLLCGLGLLGRRGHR